MVFGLLLWGIIDPFDGFWGSDLGRGVCGFDFFGHTEGMRHSLDLRVVLGRGTCSDLM